MTGNRIALDTNQAISVLSARADAGQWLASFDAVYLPVPVIGELRYGALNSRRSVENLRSVEQLVAHCQALDVTAATAEAYAQLRLGLKQAGTPIPENDIWIAALCVQHALPLATDDGHFAHVLNLRTIRR